MKTEIIESYTPQSLFGDMNTNKLRKPNFDVGEYLPPVAKGCIEIARICLSSTTGDVISIRAKKVETSFLINVVDEYETKFYEYKKKYASIPSQGEIFGVIVDMSMEPESQPYCLAIVESNGFKTIDDITSFIYIDSIIYPDLNILFTGYFKNNGYK